MRNIRILTLLAIALTAAVLGFGSLRAEVYSGSCGGSKSGTNIRWMLDTETGQLTLKGTGAMQNYMYITDPAPWFEVRMAIRHVTVTDGITSVGTWAFDQCFFLEDITLGKDISEVPMEETTKPPKPPMSLLQELTLLRSSVVSAKVGIIDQNGISMSV